MVDLGTSIDELHVMKVCVFLHKRERERREKRWIGGGEGLGKLLLNRSTDQAKIVNKNI